MYVCCCCCRNQDLNKRVRPKKNKYQLGAIDNGSHKLLEGGEYARGPSRQRYSTGNPSTSPHWREEDDFGSVDTIDNGDRTARPNSTRSARSTRSSRSGVRRSTSRRRSARDKPAAAPVVDLSGELNAAADVSSSIMARNADGSRPGTMGAAPHTARSRRGPSRPGSAGGASASSGSSSSGSDSSSGTDSDSDAQDARSTARARTPGRTLSRPAMSNAPLTSRSRRDNKPRAAVGGALVPDMDLSTLSSEDAGDSRSGSFVAIGGGPAAASNSQRRESLSNLNL